MKIDNKLKIGDKVVIIDDGEGTEFDIVGINPDNHISINVPDSLDLGRSIEIKTSDGYTLTVDEFFLVKISER